MALLENVVGPQRWNARAGLLTRSCRKPPSPQGDQGPDSLDQTKRPSPLKEPVNRRQRASCCERQNKPPTAFLQCVADPHRRDGEQAQETDWIHAGALYSG